VLVKVTVWATFASALVQNARSVVSTTMPVVRTPLIGPHARRLRRLCARPRMRVPDRSSRWNPLPSIAVRLLFVTGGTASKRVPGTDSRSTARLSLRNALEERARAPR
jgi:hypothetical protein